MVAWIWYEETRGPTPEEVGEQAKIAYAEHIEKYTKREDGPYFGRYADTVDCWFHHQDLTPPDIRTALVEEFRLAGYRTKLLASKVHSSKEGVVTLLARVRREAPDRDPVEEKRVVVFSTLSGMPRITHEVSRDAHACFEDEAALEALEFF